MKRILILALALAAACAVRAQSRIETYTVPSEILGVEKTCSVYLPDGYDASTGEYPVLYLLHGAWGCHTDWVEKGEVQRIADEAFAGGMARPMIIVMPDASGEDANHGGRNMGYFDVPGWNYEQFFFTEFIPTVEKHYRILSDKEHRAIAGLSMGGGGTAVYALRHPEMFSSACPLSGLLDDFPSPRGYQDTFIDSVATNSPVKLLGAMTEEELAGPRSVRWRVDCGDDDFLYELNVRFYTLMRRRNVPVEYRMRDGGHTWHYWRTGLTPILTFVTVGFGE